MNTLAIFGISVLVGLVSCSMVAKLYVWPRVGNLEQNRALAALVAPHAFRFMGLSFLVPGVVSPSLPSGFAIPAAYGDFAACVLAIIATVALLQRASWAMAAGWLFNLWGTGDLLFAFYRGQHAGLQPGALGAAFFIVTALVPALLVSHALIFGLLVRPAGQQLRHPQVSR